jgi:hypothetical protein
MQNIMTTKIVKIPENIACSFVHQRNTCTFNILINVAVLECSDIILTKYCRLCFVQVCRHMFNLLDNSLMRSPGIKGSHILKARPRLEFLELPDISELHSENFDQYNPGNPCNLSDSVLSDKQ